MTEHHFSRTPPADRHEVTHTATDYEPCRTTVMIQEAIRVDDCSRIKPVSIFAGDKLAAVQVAGENEVVAGVAGRLPDSRVMPAQDTNIGIDVRRGFGA
jgi:hypothetical protein